MKISVHLWTKKRKRRSDKGHSKYQGEMMEKMSKGFLKFLRVWWLRQASSKWNQCKILFSFFSVTQKKVITKKSIDESQSIWTIYVECSPHCHHRALGQLMIWIAFQLYSRWIGYSKKNAFIYWHNFGNRLVKSF